jgi:DNA integrity scanning protein DisA with diadenylate cyclase activity
MDSTVKPLEELCSPERGVNPQTLEEVLVLAVEIAREGREGRKIGTLFILGDVDRVFSMSRPLILDPLYGHPPESKRVTNPNMRETLKELAQLDGGFIISDDGVVLSGARYFDTSSEGIRIPLGLGSRHMAGASITRRTKAVAVVVSESSIVRLFDNGELISEIIPELWLLNRYSSHLEAPVLTRSDEQVTVLSRVE